MSVKKTRKGLTRYSDRNTIHSVKHMTLRGARDLRNWSQEQLEAASGIAQATISKIERGEVLNPSNDTVKNLEVALRVPRGTLVFGQAMEQAS